MEAAGTDRPQVGTLFLVGGDRHQGPTPCALFRHGATRLWRGSPAVAYSCHGSPPPLSRRWHARRGASLPVRGKGTVPSLVPRCEGQERTHPDMYPDRGEFRRHRRAPCPSPVPRRPRRGAALARLFQTRRLRRRSVVPRRRPSRRRAPHGSRPPGRRGGGREGGRRRRRGSLFLRLLSPRDAARSRARRSSSSSAARRVLRRTPPPVPGSGAFPSYSPCYSPRYSLCYSPCCGCPDGWSVACASCVPRIPPCTCLPQGVRRVAVHARHAFCRASWASSAERRSVTSELCGVAPCDSERRCVWRPTSPHNAAAVRDEASTRRSRRDARRRGVTCPPRPAGPAGALLRGRPRAVRHVREDAGRRRPSPVHMSPTSETPRSTPTERDQPRRGRSVARVAVGSKGALYFGRARVVAVVLGTVAGPPR